MTGEEAEKGSTSIKSASAAGTNLNVPRGGLVGIPAG
jgi:hypothetical protein